MIQIQRRTDHHSIYHVMDRQLNVYKLTGGFSAFATAIDGVPGSELFHEETEDVLIKKISAHYKLPQLLEV